MYANESGEEKKEATIHSTENITKIMPTFVKDIVDRDEYELPLPERAVFPPDTREYFKAAFGEKDFDQLAKSLLTPPKYTCCRISRNYNIDNVLISLNKALEEFNQRITITGRKPVHATKHPILKDMILIPSVEANYDFPNKNDLPGYRCIIDRRCAEAVLRGSDIYAKGVLSLSKGCNKIGKQVTILATLTHKKIPRGTPVDYFLKAAPVVFIGVGDLKMIRNKVLSGMPDGLAVEVNKRWKRDAPSMNGVISKQVFMQNLPSACVPHALAPKENDLVLDLCAAPGGKTTHIAQLMNNKGLVIALDRSYKKVKKIKSLCKTLNITIVKAYYADSTQVVLPQKKDEQEIKNTTKEEEKNNLSMEPLSISENLNNQQKPLNNANNNDTFHIVKQNIIGDEKHLGLSMVYMINYFNRYYNKNKKNKKKNLKPLLKRKAKKKKQQQNPTISLRDDLYSVTDIVADATIREKAELKRKDNEGNNINDIENIVVPIKGFPAETFDKILLDGPCSALGLRPRLEQNLTLDFLKGIQIQQESIMFSAAFLLKPGGTMVYSTCTFNPMENECVIANTLRQYPLELIPLPSPVNQIGERGMEGYGLTTEQCNLVRRFNPHSKFDTIGFFIARLRKYDTIRSQESIAKFHNGARENKRIKNST